MGTLIAKDRDTKEATMTTKPKDEDAKVEVRCAYCGGSYFVRLNREPIDIYCDDRCAFDAAEEEIAEELGWDA